MWVFPLIFVFSFAKFQLLFEFSLWNTLTHVHMSVYVHLCMCIVSWVESKSQNTKQLIALYSVMVSAEEKTGLYVRLNEGSLCDFCHLTVLTPQVLADCQKLLSLVLPPYEETSLFQLCLSHPFAGCLLLP